MVELPGPGKGTDDKVVGIGGGIRVVDSEGVDKNREKVRIIGTLW